MTLYEVDLRVEYSRKVMVEKGDEDAAVEEAIWNEDVQITTRPGHSGLNIQEYSIRVVPKEEMEG